MSRMSRNPRRILFCTVTQEPGHGGIARVSALLWKVIQDNFPDSCECLVAAPAGKDSPGLFDKTRFSAAAIRRQLRRGCDLIMFDHLGLARVQTAVPAAFRRPYGVFLHSLEAWAPRDGSASKALVGASLRVANSRYTAKRVMDANPGVGPVDVCHLALGAESGWREPGAAAGDAVPKIRPESVLIVGRMMAGERYKGHDQLIQAWPLVLKSLARAQLVVAGRGDDTNRLKSLAASLGVEEHVLFTGRVAESVLPEIYRRSAVFAMPSRAEGFGIVYLEAMRHRLPCIGSVHDAAGEIIADGATGFLVDQDDRNALACRIVQLLADEALRRRMGACGFERLQRQFSPEQFNTTMSGLLLRLAGEA